MFNVLSIEYNDIFNLLIRIDSIKMLVNLDKFIDYENWDSLKLYLKSSYYLLSHKEKKYCLEIELILTSAKIIRDCGNYNNIRIDLNEGYIDLTTLPNQ